MSGPRSTPPELPGFRYVEWLGGGGFADVFLYEQARPFRKVAIKVLRLPALDEADRRKLDSEADLMARVSAHPYIVSVFDVGTAADGRPYLVMECYPGPHLGDRSRVRPLGVAEALRLGVQLSSAVEAAHRAGVLHRDIKPANVLLSEYGRPGLTDFGIAAATDSATEGAMSIPFAPPEVLAGGAADVRSDVYSLAATVYALLAGRSPFESPVLSNASDHLWARVLNDAPPPTGRADVPALLENVLAHALAKTPDHRPASALAFARSLQEVERHLSLGVTDLEVRADEQPQIARPTGEDDDLTRAARVQVVTPERDAVVSSGSAPVVPFAIPTPAAPPVAETVSRGLPTAPTAAGAEPASAGSATSSSRRLLVAGAAVGVVLALVGGVSLAGDDGRDRLAVDETPVDEEPEDQPALSFDAPPGPPTGVSVKRTTAGVVVTWTAAAAQPDDVYRISRTDKAGAGTAYVETADLSTVLDVPAGQVPCVSVSVVRSGRISDASPPTCLTA